MKFVVCVAVLDSIMIFIVVNSIDERGRRLSSRSVGSVQKGAKYLGSILHLCVRVHLPNGSSARPLFMARAARPFYSAMDLIATESGLNVK